MSIPAHARGKARESRVQRPLDEIQVDTVPNPEPMGLSADTRFNYLSYPLCRAQIDSLAQFNTDRKSVV